MKEKTIKKLLSGHLRKKLFRYYNGLFILIGRRLIARSTRIEPDKVIFCTTRGSYNCNPRAIADEIIRRQLPWKLVWVVNEGDLHDLNDFPRELRLVPRYSYEFYREAESARVLIDNSIGFYNLYVIKKPGQILMETWHGSLGLKRFETNPDRRWRRRAEQSGKDTDYVISNSDFEDGLYRNNFWKNAEILKYGHARNDILLVGDSDRRSRLISRVRQVYGIPDSARIALYGPTYRDNKTDLRPYAVDYDRLRRALEIRFGGEWVILTRLHFEVRMLARTLISAWPSFVYDASEYTDIQDLMLAADVGITDYSSWIYDYLLTGKPGFIYATDLDSVDSVRGFYFPIDTTPFPVAGDDDALEKNILEFDQDAYRVRCEEFLADKGCVDDGHAAERIVDKLEELLSQSSP